MKTHYPTQYDQFVRKAKDFTRHVPDYSVNYVKGLFPIASWLPRYNRDWLWGDLIAGLTVGIVVIPQALAYAKLASLPLQYGLYTSFTGVVLYCLFATSKDVTIGATAVASQLTGQILASHNKDLDPVAFAISLAFLTGIMQLAIGLLRLGIIVDFIPAPVIAGFTTGAGIGIIIGQIAGLLGITGINTNDSAYLVLGNTFRKLGETKLDAAFGFSGLIFLLIFKFGCAHLVKRGYPYMRWVGLARNALVVIVFTAISYGINNGLSKPRIRIVGNVPKGFGTPRVPDLHHLSSAAPAAVTVLIVCVLEHIAVVKSYGRLNGYTPNPNQELVALGFTNFLGSFMGAYPATGSFSRSAIKSQSGVRSPLAALFTAVIVILALYVLTPLFTFIPSSILSAIIVSAISDLISRPALVKQLWDIQFLDFFAFLLALLFTFFFSIETAIYVSVGFSVLVLLYRVARPHYSLMTRTSDGSWVSVKDAHVQHQQSTPPPPGILVFRLEESLTYPNAHYFAEHIMKVVIESTEYGGAQRTVGERLWCDDTEDRVKRARKAELKRQQNKNMEVVLSVPDLNRERTDSDTTITSPAPLPRLHSLVLDFSAVNNLDSTGVQMLVDLRRDVDTYAGQRVEIHFAHVRPRFERILEYFLAITRTDRDVTPVVPHSNPGGDETSSRRGDVEIGVLGGEKEGEEDVRRYFHCTVDVAVGACERGREKRWVAEREKEVEEVRVEDNNVRSEGTYLM